MNKKRLLNKTTIICGILLYIVLGEASKDLFIFPVIEPILFEKFDEALAEKLSEFSEYFLLAAIFIPVAFYFVINPVNRTNLYLMELWDETSHANFELTTEIEERRKIEAENQRLISELKEALKEIRTLEGILPICSHCKEIRNDNGYWVRLEKYISEHSEAQFTHTICEKCMEEHYPSDADDNGTPT